MNTIEKIEQALTTNKLQIAYDLCSKAIKEDCQPPLLKLMAEIFLRSGEYFAAGNALLKYINDFGFDASVAVDCASAYQISSNNQITAVRLSKKCIAFKNDLNQTRLNTLATILMQHDLLDEAFDVLKFVCEGNDLSNDSMYNMATCYKFLGDFASCEYWLRCILDNGVTHPQVFSTLASLPGQRFTPDDEKAILDLLSNNIDSIDKQPLYHALYQFSERQKRYPEAFRYLQQANNEEKARIGPTSTNLKDSYKNAMHLFKTLPPHSSLHTASTNSPIFVVGLPRTGTTLTARILSGHPGVIDAGERPFLSQCLAPILAKSGLMPLSQQLALSPLKSMVDSYVDIIQEVSGQSERFVDQKPTNYSLIGFIKLLIPNAKIIEVVRDPMDTCFSNYRQFYNRSVTGLHYTCDLDEIVDHFDHYRKLMNFWHKKFPKGIYQLNYENLVGNTLGEAESLFRYCDLTFKPEYIQIERLTSGVSTASATQLREPVHSNYVGRWKNYGPLLINTQNRISKLSS